MRKLCRALSAECTQGPECTVQSAISVQLIQVHGSKSFKPILPHTCPAHAVLQTAKAARSRPHAPWRPLWSSSQASCSRRRLRRARPHADSRHAAKATPDAWAARPAPSSSRSPHRPEHRHVDVSGVDSGIVGDRARFCPARSLLGVFTYGKGCKVSQNPASNTTKSCTFSPVVIKVLKILGGQKF